MTFAIDRAHGRAGVVIVDLHPHLCVC
jgi:hypothetical protein